VLFLQAYLCVLYGFEIFMFWGDSFDIWNTLIGITRKVTGNYVLFYKFSLNEHWY
jgi:hypothetical protein